MPEAPRVSPGYVHERLASGADTLFVCAYDDPEKCRAIHLEGSLDMRQLEAKLPGVAKDREIVFYCG